MTKATLSPRRLLTPLTLTLGLVAAGCDTPAPAPTDAASQLTGETVFFDGSTLEEQDLARELANGALLRVLEDHGLTSLQDFSPTRISVDELGHAHVRVQQHLNGVPVFGGEAIVHLAEDGRTLGLSDNLVDAPMVDTTPSVTLDDALDRAVAQSFGWDRLTDDPSAALWVLRRDGQDHLTWRVELEQLDGSADTAMEVLFIDAHTGELVWRYDNLHTVSATGASNYSGTVNLKVYKGTGSYTGYYLLEHPSKGIGTYTLSGSEDASTYAQITDNNTAFTEAAQAEGVDAHWAAEQTYDFYKNSYGWIGLDGAGGPGYAESLDGTGRTVISLLVNYGTSYADAMWTGDYAAFGDGDGSTTSSWTSVDIVGHELTHGVTDATAGFTYSGESGALDEAISDIMGEMVEMQSYGWTAPDYEIGQDFYTPGTSGDAWRYMDDPTMDGSSLDYYVSDAGDYDVHYASGIINQWFYLCAEGGTHASTGAGPMTGVGAQACAEIVFYTLRDYLSSSSTMAQFGEHAQTVAFERFGPGADEICAVQDASYLTGIYGSGCTSTSTICPGFDDGLTGTLKAVGGVKWYPSSAGGAYAAGDHYGLLVTGAGVDFNLYLYWWDSAKSKWKVAGQKIGTSTTKNISYTGTATDYRWKIKSESGAGSYSFCVNTP